MQPEAQTTTRGSLAVSAGAWEIGLLFKAPLCSGFIDWFTLLRVTLSDTAVPPLPCIAEQATMLYMLLWRAKTGHVLRSGCGKGKQMGWAVKFRCVQGSSAQPRCSDRECKTSTTGSKVVSKLLSWILMYGCLQNYASSRTVVHCSNLWAVVV